MHDRGLITEGSMLEFLHSHSSVVFQPGFDDPRFSGLNPYALGFTMMSDIQRICDDPTEEDQAWFPEIAGCRDAYRVLRDAWANYRDESFILQYMSPEVIRKFRLFQIADDSGKPALRVDAIHDELGYRKIRSALSRQYDLSRREPDVQVVDVDLTGDRTLVLAHYVHDGVLLDEKTCRSVLRYTAHLWGYSVKAARNRGGHRQGAEDVRVGAGSEVMLPHARDLPSAGCADAGDPGRGQRGDLALGRIPSSASTASLCSPSAATRGCAAARVAEKRKGGFITRKLPPASCTSASAPRCSSCGSASASRTVR